MGGFGLWGRWRLYRTIDDPAFDPAEAARVSLGLQEIAADRPFLDGAGERASRAQGDHGFQGDHGLHGRDTEPDRCSHRLWLLVGLLIFVVLTPAIKR